MFRFITFGLLLVGFILPAWSQFLAVEPNSSSEDFFLMTNKLSRFEQLQGLVIRKSKIPKNLIKPYSLSNYVDYEVAENDTSVKLNSSVALLKWKKGNNRILINPTLNVTVSDYSSGFLQNNARGASLRTHLFGKISAIAHVQENQTYFPDYVNQYRDTFGVVPGIGFWKNYKKDGSDYFRASGYLAGNLFTDESSNSYVHATFGHFNQRFGKGIRSLFMGGNTPSNLGLRLVTNLNQTITYTNYFGQMNGFSPLLGNVLLPKKYMAGHRLGVNFGKHKQYGIGLFEAVIHSRNNGTGGFDLDYINPIIFYRSVESSLGSADNALLGLDLNYDSRFGEFYGQLLVDEFKLSEISKDWWGNKFGYQVGYRHINTLDDSYGHIAQVEYNSIRPYTYSHYNPLNSYSHYNQAIAHPYGANLHEFIARYKGVFPQLKNTWLDLNFMLLSQGLDTFQGSSNMGANFRLSNDTRPADYNVVMLQGQRNNVMSLSVSVGKMLFHRFSVALGYQYRRETLFDVRGSYLSFSLRYQVNAVRAIL